MYFSRFTIFCCLFPMSLGLVDYCDENKRNSSILTPGIQFTKELSSSEYAVLSSFKSLHCCAKGYRSIEWFKDGKAYPWPGDVSSFILYPDSANQTIYSQALGSVDAGNYTCTVANDSRQVSHIASLTVFDMRKNYMDVPLPTYKLPAEHFVRLGQPARMYCEAFVGKIDLPDATNEVWWERPGMNMSTPQARRYIQHRISREEEQVVGAYLFIEKVNLADFGSYVCSISNTEDQVVRLTTELKEEDWEMGLPSNKIPWLKLQFIVITILLAATLVIVYNRYALSALLYVKLKFCKRPVDDGKEHDLLICYSPEDADFAVGVLATTLGSRYHHTVTLCQINNARASAELQLASTLSRHLLVVMSPSLFENQWTPVTICPLFKQLSDIHSNIICVPLQGIKMDASWKSEEGCMLRQLLSRCSVITWEVNTPAQRRRFWTSLRLCLPPPLSPPSTRQREMTATTTTKAKLSTFAKSNESLEVLV
ncbi:X-linked interleukin-1 receptor accessory protein-like 2 [Homalodisca vitripennis]|nr:X-linked interleukin-1 receptor accessory protein-like 2 [Homalodisca vitripennis]